MRAYRQHFFLVRTATKQCIKHVHGYSTNLQWLIQAQRQLLGCFPIHVTVLT
jgi:hypothetical protein